MMSSRRKVVSFAAIAIFIVAAVAFIERSREVRFNQSRGLEPVSSYITGRMIAENPLKYVGRRVRVTCLIDTFIDGPIEGPSAYASCRPTAGGGAYGSSNAAHFILRGDQFRDLDVDDTLTVVGIVDVDKGTTPMGGRREFYAIDVDTIERLTRSTSDGELR